MDRDSLLRLLFSRRDGYLSGAELAGRFNLSRTAVWKQIRTLEREGFRIEAVPSKGYRLLETPDVIIPSLVRDALASPIIAWDLVVLAETASTNTVAMERAQQGAAEGLVIVAERQSGGRGRLGRNWFSPPGNLYLSVVLRPPVVPQRAPLITLMGAVAVARSLRGSPGIPAGIKWPNDILVNDRKVCGLLTEMLSDPDRVRHIVLGIGINVNGDLMALPPEVRCCSTTLAAARRAPVDRNALLASLLGELARWYAAFLQDGSAVLDAWRELNVTLGRNVTVISGGSPIQGFARDIDAEGRLVLETASGVRTIAAGDVTIEKERR